MRALVVGMAVLGWWLSAAPGSRAGVYNLDEPPSQEPALESPGKQISRPVQFEAVWRRLIELRGVARQGRLDYDQQARELLEKLRQDGTLETRQYVSLGGCLSRLGRAEQARTVLEEGLHKAGPEEPARFLLLLNLAAANMTPDDLLPRAVDYQQRALAAWPTVWAGWDARENFWNRRVETFTLTLLQARQREALQSGGRSGSFTALDPLFPRVRFVGPSGEYEAGKLAFASWNELPGDAEPVVVQILLAHPNDPRLLWLYGELLNARGDVESAFQVLNYLVDSLSGIRELRNHRAVLKYTLPVIQALAKQGTKEKLLWAVTPRGMPVPGGVGDLSGMAAAFAVPAENAIALPPPDAAPVSRLPDWRTLLVGFAMGVLAATLGFFQWAELRRRRVGRQASKAARHTRSAAPHAPRPTVHEPEV
jgi:tetratricopeptide (TPR) repeat protein